MSKLKGRYLKEISIEFLLKNKIDSYYVRNFIDELVTTIETEIVSLSVNELPPGFDVLVGIKESCIYFGYWAQYDYCKLNISSCRDFDANQVLILTKGYFEPESINLVIYNDKRIVKAVKDLKCQNKKN